MILKALYDYYHRSGDKVAPLGLEYRVIDFTIVIDNEGNLCRIEDNPVEKLVIKSNGRTGKNFLPNFLWDKFSFVLGISVETICIDDKNLSAEKKKKYDIEIRNNIKKHSAFLKLVDELHSLHPDDEDLTAIVNFYKKNNDILS